MGFRPQRRVGAVFLFVVENNLPYNSIFAEKVVYLQLYCGLTEGQAVANMSEIKDMQMISMRFSMQLIY